MHPPESGNAGSAEATDTSWLLSGRAHGICVALPWLTSDFRLFKFSLMSRDLNCPIHESVFVHVSLHEVALHAARHRIRDQVSDSVIHSIDAAYFNLLVAVMARFVDKRFEFFQS